MIGTEKRTVYKAFGLRISSDILLPELDQCSNIEDNVDLEIKYGDLSETWNRLSYPEAVFIVKEDLIMFQIPDTATFCIQNSNKIIVCPMNGADLGKIRLYILGTCMGAILLQNRLLPLHGSAVEINGEAYAFIGESGAGKSTLAAAFLNNGYKLLSDDVIAVSLSNDNIPHVIPSFPQQKLWHESLDQFGMDKANLKPLFERETKYAVPILTKFYEKPLPLAGIFELVKTPNDEIEMHKIGKLECLLTLLNHTYRKSLIRRLGLQEWHFTYSSRVLSNIEIFKLQRPTSKFTAQNLVTLILNTIK
ncbi:aldolase [Neobacillus drentensis]|uniref:aldolase n=1 Tax=Neobacillus drentensis TaxID=220684 RepID=UPI002FFFA9BE